MNKFFLLYVKPASHFLYLAFFFVTAQLLASDALTPKDAFYAMERGKGGILLARETVELFNAMSEHLEYDQETERFFRFMNGALEDFDFAGIFKSPWMHDETDGFRALALSGARDGEKYRVKLAPVKPSLKKMGDAYALYRMRKNKVGGDTTYTSQWQFDAALKKFHPQAWARFLETLLKVASPKNISLLKPARSEFFSEVKAPTRALLDSAAQDFPALSAFVSKYVELRSWAAVEKANEKEYTEFVLRAHLKLDALKSEFPRLRKFLLGLKNLFILKLSLFDAKGNTLLSFVLNTQTEELYLAFKTAEGKIIPTDRKGELAWRDAFSLTGTSDKKLSLGMSAFVSVYGLKINTGYLGASLRYRMSHDSMRAYFKLAHADKAKISGALFGVLPPWVIDLSIPSNLQYLMNRFTEVILNANQGKGSYALLDWKKNHGNARLKVAASTEFLENPFIRIGMRIWVRRFRPNERVQEELRVLFARATRAFLKDLSKL